MLKLVVLICAFVAATAAVDFYSGPLAIAAQPIAYTYPYVQPYNYRGPLSLAPGQPADILGADGRPLDTLEVNQDRVAHFAAKTGLHLLKKRSAAISIAAAPLSYAAHFAGRPIAYTAPFPTGYIAPIVRPVAIPATNIVRHY